MSVVTVALLLQEVSVESSEVPVEQSWLGPVLFVVLIVAITVIVVRRNNRK